MASAPGDPPISPSSPPPPSQSTKPFRFKSKRRHSPSTSDPDPPPKRRDSTSPSNSHRHSTHHHHHHHRHHHKSRRRPRTPTHDPTNHDNDPTFPCENHDHSKPLDPDAAFRESLFDALADDEGASFWQGVYGQPIHHYSPYKANDDNDDDDDDYNETGAPKLERMSDEEYVSYVRSKMWERSHEYIVEERRKREERRKLEAVKREEERRWRLGVEEGLKRGVERRERDRWRRVWEGYVGKWERTFASCAETGEGGSMKERISWPVESGGWRDVRGEEVERFFGHAPQAAAAAAAGRAGAEMDLGDVLKKERVRWHPDKMQQRTGSAGIDEGTMKIVTGVFQVVDRLWSENKGRG